MDFLPVYPGITAQWVVLSHFGVVGRARLPVHPEGGTGGVGGWAVRVAGGYTFFGFFFMSLLLSGTPQQQ